MSHHPRVTEGFLASGRFREARPLGSGGMGVVYEVYDTKRRERVALKTMSRVDPETIYRLKQEFRALSDVVHPNLVVLHELTSQDDQWFFTMELLEGTDFLRYVRQVGPNVPRERAEAETIFASEATSLPADGDGPDPDRETVANPDSVSSQPLAVVPTVAGASVSGLISAGAVAPTVASVSGLISAGAVAPTVPSAPTVLAPGVAMFQGGPVVEVVMASPPEPRTRANLVRLRQAMVQLAEGLQALHGAGKLHRDIKPSNVMVTREGRVVLLDFGLAVDAAPRRHSDEHDIAGTPDYMAPEQMAAHALGPAADWFSVGVMLYEALTGQLPHGRWESYTQLLKEKRRGNVVPPSRMAPEIDPVLDALCLDLLKSAPEERPSGQEVLRRLAGQTTSPSSRGTPSSGGGGRLVGRAPHLAALAGAFADAKSGRTVTLYVEGISGMGKSALMRHFLDGLVARDEAVVLEGRCYERESVPYKGLDSLIDGLSRHLASLPSHEATSLLPEHVAALRRVFPVLERVKEIADAARGAAEVPDQLELRRRAFGALRELLSRMAKDRPLVLHIDDLQWGDLDSAALVSELLRPPDAPTLLLVGSFRSEARARSASVRALPQPGTTGYDVRELSVEPLAFADATALAAALLGPEHAKTHAEAVGRESNGSPFFIHELARQVTEGGARLDKAVTLDDVLRGRLARLPEEAQRLLEIVTVAGRPIAEPLVREAASLGADENAALAVLRAGHLVRVRGGLDADEVETFHDRIREIVVAHTSPERLATCHRRLATALEGTGRADPEALAEHWKGAGELVKAGDYALRAAEQADRALAFDRAAKLYRFALDLRSGGDPSLRALRGKLGDALANAGRSAEAAEVYLAAARGADTGERLEFDRRAAEQLLISGHVDEGRRTIDRVLDAVGMKLAKNAKRAVVSLVIRRARLKLRGLRFRERAASEIPAADLLRMDACWAVARGLGMIDHIRANDLQTEQLLLALASGEPYRIARGLAMEAAFMSGPGGPNREVVKKLSAEARALAARIDNPHAIGLSTFTAGMGHYLRGEFRQALALCEEAEAILRERCSNVAWELASAHRFALGSLLYLGEVRELRNRVRVLLAAARARGDLYAATDIRTRFNIAWLAADDPDEARRQIDEAMAEWSNEGFHLQHYSSLLALTQLDLYRGDARAAWARVTETWPALQSSMLLRVQMVRVEAYHLRARSALAAALQGDREALLAQAEADAQLIAKEAMPWCAPWVPLLRAAIAAQRDKPTTAEVLLAEAVRGFDASEMKLYAAAARRRLGALRGERGHRDLGEADAHFAAGEIRAPDRLMDMLAPGFPR